MTHQCTCGAHYLSRRQNQVRELKSLASDFYRIKENTDIELEHRYYLAMHDECYGRIQTLFDELNIPSHVGELSPRILGYETCLNLTWTEIEYRCNSLSGLLNDQN